MVRISKFIRHWARFLAGIAFWLHAVLLVAIPMPSLETFATRVELKASEVLLGLFFVTMAILNGYGFWRFLLDLIYIYFSPFIFIYKAAVFGFKAASRLSKAYASRFFPEMQRRSFTWREMLRELVADDSALVVPTTTAPGPSQPVGVVASAQPQGLPKRSLWSRLLLPFRSFTMAWCLLIIATDKPAIALFGLIVLGAHLLRFIVNLATVLATAQQFLKNAEINALNYATGLLNLVMSAPEETLANPDVAQAVTYLGLLRGSAFLSSQFTSASLFCSHSST